MNNQTISPDNKLTNILDFDVCKRIFEDAVKNGENYIILCPHYSINIASKYEDSEGLQYDLDELSEYIGAFIEVNDYDDLVIDLTETD